MTLTKEWLLKTISELEEERDAIPGAVNEDAAMALAAMKLALASLTADPVAYIDPFSLQNFATYRAGETDNKRMGREWMWADSDAGLVPVYTAPPAPVVPDIGEISVGRLPTMNQDDYPGLGDWWVQLRIGKDSDEVLARVYGATPQEANSRAVALACRAAMLQGAAGNSPAIPDGYALVPVEPTAEMISSGIAAHYERSNIQIHDRPAPGPMECAYVAMLAAAPQQEVK